MVLWITCLPIPAGHVQHGLQHSVCFLISFIRYNSTEQHQPIVCDLIHSVISHRYVTLIIIVLKITVLPTLGAILPTLPCDQARHFAATQRRDLCSLGLSTSSVHEPVDKLGSITAKPYVTGPSAI